MAPVQATGALDFQRIAAGEKMHLKVPTLRRRADVALPSSSGGCMISHTINPDSTYGALPTDLPEFIEVDPSALEAGQSVHVCRSELPAGVELVQHGEGDPVVATALQVKWCRRSRRRRRAGLDRPARMQETDDR